MLGRWGPGGFSCEPAVALGDLVIAFQGRLDNHVGAAPEAVAEAFHRWGERCPEYLIGDFALALWDGRRLILARDPFGVAPLFYRWDGSTFVWGTRLDSVRADGEIDEGWIAGYLAHVTSRTETPYRHVRAVSPGHVVVVEDGSMRSAPFWTPIVRPTRPLANDRAYEERFAELFTEAVRCRLQVPQPVLAELSGGLDSSSIVCVADALVRAREVPAPELLTVSNVYHRSRSSDEQVFVRAVEDHIGRAGLAISEADGPAFTDLHVRAYEHPTAFECVKVREAPRHKLIAARGVGVVLSGFGGDNVVHAEFDPALPLADVLHTEKSLRGLTSWHRASGTPYPVLIAGALARAGFARQHHRRELRRWRDTLFTCLTEEFARRSRVLDRLTGLMPMSGAPSKRRQAAAIELAIRSVSWMYDPGPDSCPTAYPFLHRPLVEFCQTVPSEQFLRPGQTRSLHRRALRGLLPPIISSRQDKRGPDEATQRDLAKAWPTLRSWLGDLELVRRGIVDAAAFRQAIDLARFGRRRGDLLFLLKAIALEAWLRTL